LPASRIKVAHAISSKQTRPAVFESKEDGPGGKTIVTYFGKPAEGGGLKVFVGKDVRRHKGNWSVPSIDSPKVQLRGRIFTTTYR